MRCDKARSFGYNLGMTTLPYTVGIEIEFNTLAGEIGTIAQTVVNRYSAKGWTFARDGSCGFEIRSGILKTYADITASVADVCAALVRDGARIDERCGLHVHIGWQNVRDTSAKYRLFRLCCHYEDAFFNLASPARQNNHFCARLSPEMRTAMSTGQAWAAWPERESRYHWLNGQNMQDHNVKTTVEFRLMASTVSADFITGWIALLLCLVDTACNDRTKAPWENDAQATWTDLARAIHVVKAVRLPELAALVRAWYVRHPRAVLPLSWADANDSTLGNACVDAASTELGLTSSPHDTIIMDSVADSAIQYALTR